MGTFVTRVGSVDDDEWAEVDLRDEVTTHDAAEEEDIHDYQPVFHTHRAIKSKQNTKDIKVAVGVALLVLGVLAAVAALVLTFAFAIPFIPIVLTITLAAAGSSITGIALILYSVIHKRKSA
jgi:hypothetical protein